MSIEIKEQGKALIIEIGDTPGRERWYFKTRKEMYKVIDTILDIKFKHGHKQDVKDLL